VLTIAGTPNTSATPPLPTKRSFVNPDATVYVTAGNGGSPGPDGGAGQMPGARRGSEQYGYGRLVAHNASHLTWTQIANSDFAGEGVVLDCWTVVQHHHGQFQPGPGTPPPGPAPPPPPPAPAPPSGASLQLVALDICRHYWNWACNASGIPGGVDGGGQGACCMANRSNPWFSWRDQGSHSPKDLQLYTARPASADPCAFFHPPRSTSIYSTDPRAFYASYISPE
jgi:hypothetical protein